MVTKIHFKNGRDSLRRCCTIPFRRNMFLGCYNSCFIAILRNKGNGNVGVKAYDTLLKHIKSPLKNAIRGVDGFFPFKPKINLDSFTVFPSFLAC